MKTFEQFLDEEAAEVSTTENVKGHDKPLSKKPVRRKEEEEEKDEEDKPEHKNK